MNVTGFKNKRRCVILLLREYEKIPDGLLNYKDQRNIFLLKIQAKWLAKEIKRVKALRVKKGK